MLLLRKSSDDGSFGLSGMASRRWGGRREGSSCAFGTVFCSGGTADRAALDPSPAVSFGASREAVVLSERSPARIASVTDSAAVEGIAALSEIDPPIADVAAGFVCGRAGKSAAGSPASAQKKSQGSEKSKSYHFHSASFQHFQIVIFYQKAGRG